jgi:hypothetical protein
MQKGNEEILWIDSDVIVTKNVTGILAEVPNDAIIVTEEALWSPHDDDDAWRARKWGFHVGRVLPFALNTGVVRVTRAHQRAEEHSTPIHLPGAPWLPRSIKNNVRMPILSESLCTPKRLRDVLNPSDRDPSQIHLDQRFLDRALTPPIAFDNCRFKGLSRSFGIFKLTSPAFVCSVPS